MKTCVFSRESTIAGVGSKVKRVREERRGGDYWGKKIVARRAFASKLIMNFSLRDNEDYAGFSCPKSIRYDCANSVILCGPRVGLVVRSRLRMFLSQRKRKEEALTKV